MGRRTFFSRGGRFPAGVFTSCSSLFCCIVAAAIAVPDLVEFVEVEVPEGVHKIEDPALPVNVVSSMLSRTPRRHRKTFKNKDLATLGSLLPRLSRGGGNALKLKAAGAPGSSSLFAWQPPR